LKRDKIEDEGERKTKLEKEWCLIFGCICVAVYIQNAKDRKRYIEELL